MKKTILFEQIIIAAGAAAASLIFPVDSSIIHHIIISIENATATAGSIVFRFRADGTATAGSAGFGMCSGDVREIECIDDILNFSYRNTAATATTLNIEWFGDNN